jgi:hypothetical protein
LVLVTADYLQKPARRPALYVSICIDGWTPQIIT